MWHECEALTRRGGWHGRETTVKNTETTFVLGGASQDFVDEITNGPAKRSARLDGETLVQVCALHSDVLHLGSSG